MKISILLFLVLYSISLYATEEQVGGVGPEALSLPQSPSSIGASFGNQIDSGNAGTFLYSYPLELPKGTNNFTPSIMLNYNSAGGIGEFGQGWQYNISTIERDSKLRVPLFDENDRFSSTELGTLVKIDFQGNANNWYSPIINGNQDRLFYENDNWIMSKIDGKKLYFGTSSDSKLVVSKGTAFWKLKKEEDKNNNKITYHYLKNGNNLYIDEVRYAYKNSDYKYYVKFIYEDVGPITTTYRKGLKQVASKLCTDIYVKHKEGRVLKHYKLSYSFDSNTNVPRLFSVKLKGVDEQEDIANPIPLIKFNYSNFNKNTQDARDVNFLGGMGDFPKLNNKRLTYVDINGDSLVDIVETSSKGMKVWLNSGNGTYQESYKQNNFIRILGEKQTKLLDVDGDRIVDFVTSGLYPKFFKGASKEGGRFSFSSVENSVTKMPNIIHGSKGVRSVDLNADGRLDFLIQYPDKFTAIMSTAPGEWDKYVDTIMNTSSFDLSSNFVFVQDFNGDGVADLGRISNSDLIYLPSLGDGSFGEPVVFSFDESNREIFDLLKSSHGKYISDFNGDGLIDIAVTNIGGYSIVFGKVNNQFSSIYHSYDKLNSFSQNGFWTGVFDVDGNGVSDLVFSNDNKQVKYFSFVDVKPNLLKKIENGLGNEIIISYSNSSKYSQKGQFFSPINFPIVSKIKVKNLSSNNLEKENEYSYADPYYDGLLNEYRGFREVVNFDKGDIYRSAFINKRNYSLGKNIYHLKSKELANWTYSIDSNNNVKNLMSGKEFTYIAQNTFNSLEEDQVKMPLVSKIKYIEGDDDNLTTNRVRNDEISYVFDFNFLKTKTVSEKDSSNNLFRQKKYQFAFDSNSISSNQICETWLLDNGLSVIENRRFYYDSLSLCQKNTGMLTEERINYNNSFEVKKKYSYFPSGNIEAIFDGKNNKTEFYYDSYFINLTQVVNPLGHSVSASFDSELGVMQSFTNENSVTTSIYYDYLLRPTSLVGPLDTQALPTIKYEYKFGNLSTFSSIKESKRITPSASDMLESIRFYDSASLLVYEIAKGEEFNKYRQTKSEYSTNGKIAKKYNPIFTNGFTLNNLNENGFEQTDYDELGRIRFTYNPDYPQVPQSFKENDYKVGKIFSYDELRNKTENDFDEFGRTILAIDALNNVVSYSWDERDKLTALIDPQGSSTLFYYDNQGRRSCKLDPNIGITKYSYDTNDLLIQKDNYGFQLGATCNSPIGVPRTVQFIYDSLNRRTNIDYPVGSSTNNITFNYDELNSSYGIGKLTSTSYIQGAKTFEYDINGFLSKEIQTTTSGTYTTNFENDLIGRNKKIIYPTVGTRSLEISLSYSLMGKINAVSGSGFGQIVDDVEYNQLGQTTKIVRSNGIEDKYLFDDDGMTYRLNKIEILDNNFRKRNTKKKTKKLAGSLAEIAYTYDEASNVLAKNDILSSESEEFVYDELNRLTNFSINSVANQTFEYDEIGNITKLTDSTAKNYQYDTNRKQVLNSVGATSYTFDIFGNIASDGARSYTFDWGNRLKSLTKSGVTTNYIYDHEGLRVEKENPTSHNIYLNKYTELKNGVPIYHIFIDERRVASINEGNNLVHLHQDHLSSSILRTDVSGGTLFSQKYLPFGEGRISTGSSSNLFSLFTDQYKDEESDIYYYKQRYYSQSLGRFISADPLYLEEMDKKGVDTQTLNLYAYVKNNPQKYTDPEGLEPPENIVPFDISKNIQEARNMSFGEFIEAVRSGGQWDYKQYGSQYENLGNYNYGLVGKEVIPSETILKAGAGGYQILSGTSSWDFFNSYFDDPVDQKWIQEGINDYNDNFWNPNDSSNQGLIPSDLNGNFFNSTNETRSDI